MYNIEDSSFGRGLGWAGRMVPGEGERAVANSPLINSISCRWWNLADTSNVQARHFPVDGVFSIVKRHPFIQFSSSPALRDVSEASVASGFNGPTWSTERIRIILNSRGLGELWKSMGHRIGFTILIQPNIFYCPFINCFFYNIQAV